MPNLSPLLRKVGTTDTFSAVLDVDTTVAFDDGRNAQNEPPHTSRGAAAYVSPEPALSLPKGRKPGKAEKKEPSPVRDDTGVFLKQERKMAGVRETTAEEARAGVAIEGKRLNEILAHRQRRLGSGIRPAFSLSCPIPDVSQPRNAK
ncbi:MAG: hypothetical protein WB562_15870 [Candidatus Sulfotelmatobacter sp.]